MDREESLLQMVALVYEYLGWWEQRLPSIYKTRTGKGGAIPPLADCQVQSTEAGISHPG